MKISKKYLLATAVATVLGGEFVSDANASSIPNPTETTTVNHDELMKNIGSPEMFEHIKTQLEDKSLSLIWRMLPCTPRSNTPIKKLTKMLKKTMHELEAKLNAEKPEITSDKNADPPKLSSEKHTIIAIKKFLDASDLFFDRLLARAQIRRLVKAKRFSPTFVKNLCTLGSPENDAFISMIGEMLETEENPGIPDIEFCDHLSPQIWAHSVWPNRWICLSNYGKCYVDSPINYVDSLTATCLMASNTRFGASFPHYKFVVYHALAMAAKKGSSALIEGLPMPDTFSIERRIFEDEMKDVYVLLKNNIHSLEFYSDTIPSKFKDAFINRMKEASNLEELSLNLKRMDDTSLQYWASLISKLNNLNSLNLHVYQLGTNGFSDLCDAIKEKRSITHLNLRGTPLNKTCIQEIYSVLTDPDCSIAYLNLRNTQIGDNEIILLAEALKVNKSLVELNLEYNDHIGTKGWKALAEALKINRNLLKLSLGAPYRKDPFSEPWFHSIGDDGMILLAEAFRVNGTLVEIDLRGNQMRKRGLKALADSLAGDNLAENERKALIDVLAGKRVPLSESEILALRSILEGKKIEEAGLKVLENVLGGQNITEKGRKILLEVTKNRKSDLEEEELQALRGVLAGKKIGGLEEEELQTLHDIIRDKKIEEAGLKALEDIFDGNDITEEGKMVLKKALGNTSITSISLSN